MAIWLRVGTISNLFRTKHKVCLCYLVILLQLNTTINGPRGSGIVGDRGSREGSSVAEWPHGEEVPYWLGQQALETESVPRDKHWSSQLSPNLDSKHLCRTSSYPEQQQNQHFSTEPILVFYFDFLFFSCV
uniref:Uncharacterized protein n=1 Tax=Gossypium raimondii TaxID=29730 RepID=A0A0D2NJH4_GOSRA|nr:hypothetical protein B456_006G003000 [Gossypium raimondii]